MEKKTVLLVEDDSIIREIVRSAFEREYNILEASACSAAMKLLKDPIDIAVIDYMLPDGDGFDVLEAIRKVKPELPVIMMTAYSSEDVAIRALRAGATDYVKKPLVLTYLRRKVGDILAGAEGGDPAGTCLTREQFLLDGVAAFIDNNFSADLTREMLAEKVCMNKSKFSKAFNERFGKSLRSYLNDIRMKKAADLLRNRDLSIGEIAFSVGFGSVEHFIRVFKETYGMSPREYRTSPDNASSQGNHLWHLE
jgi:YesN/AraC family two-component response regulator